MNNHLTVRRRLLSLAVEWEQLDHLPLFKWLRVPEQKFDFLDFEEAERLLGGADEQWADDPGRPQGGASPGRADRAQVGGVDLVAGRIMVRRAIARGIAGTPKNGRTREIPHVGRVAARTQGAP